MPSGTGIAWSDCRRSVRGTRGYRLEFVQVRQDGAAVVRVGGAESTGQPRGTLFTDVGENQHLLVSGTDFRRQRVVLMVPAAFLVKRWFIVASSTPVPFLGDWSE